MDLRRQNFRRRRPQPLCPPKAWCFEPLSGLFHQIGLGGCPQKEAHGDLAALPTLQLLVTGSVSSPPCVYVLNIRQRLSDRQGVGFFVTIFTPLLLTFSCSHTAVAALPLLLA